MFFYRRAGTAAEFTANHLTQRQSLSTFRANLVSLRHTRLPTVLPL